MYVCVWCPNQSTNRSIIIIKIVIETACQEHILSLKSLRDVVLPRRGLYQSSINQVLPGSLLLHITQTMYAAENNQSTIVFEYVGKITFSGLFRIILIVSKTKLQEATIVTVSKHSVNLIQNPLSRIRIKSPMSLAHTACWIIFPQNRLSIDESLKYRHCRC